MMRPTYTKFNKLTFCASILGGISVRKAFLLVVPLGCILSPWVLAQEQEETVIVNRQTIQQMMQRIGQLEARVHELEAERSVLQFAIPATLSSDSARQPDGSHVLAEGSAAPESSPPDPEK